MRVSQSLLQPRQHDLKAREYNACYRASAHNREEIAAIQSSHAALLISVAAAIAVGCVTAAAAATLELTTLCPQSALQCA